MPKQPRKQLAAQTEAQRITITYLKDGERKSSQIYLQRDCDGKQAFWIEGCRWSFDDVQTARAFLGSRGTLPLSYGRFVRSCGHGACIEIGGCHLALPEFRRVLDAIHELYAV
jgi:hypothetical protein